MHKHTRKHVLHAVACLRRGAAAATLTPQQRKAKSDGHRARLGACDCLVLRRRVRPPLCSPQHGAGRAPHRRYDLAPRRRPPLVLLVACRKLLAPLLTSRVCIISCATATRALCTTLPGGVILTAGWLQMAHLAHASAVELGEKLAGDASLVLPANLQRSLEGRHDQGLVKQYLVALLERDSGVFLERRAPGRVRPRCGRLLAGHPPNFGLLASAPPSTHRASASCPLRRCSTTKHRPPVLCAAVQPPSIGLPSSARTRDTALQ